jgi:uncharacterized protein YxjI
MSDNWSRYRLQRKLFSIGEDFWIENEQGEQVYKVDGKAFSLRETFVLEDPNGSELLTIESKLLAVRPTMKILRDDKLVATVTKKLLTFLHQHYTIQVEGGDHLRGGGQHHQPRVRDHEQRYRGRPHIKGLVHGHRLVRSRHRPRTRPGPAAGIRHLRRRDR